MESHEGLKWELGFACFWNGKMAFIHWDWNSQSKKQLEIGMALGFKKNI